MKKRTTLSMLALTIGLMLLGMSFSKIGALFNLTVAASGAALPAGAGICGTVSAYTPANSNATGAIKIAGLTYVIARGATIPAVSVGQDRCFSFCFNGEGQITGGEGFSGYNISLVCGIVTSFSKPIAGLAGSVNIGGATVRLAPGTYLAGQDQVSPGSNTCLIPDAAGDLAGPNSYFIQSPSHKQVRIPSIVHGKTFGTNSQDDTFTLSDPTILTLNSDQASVFDAGPYTFGRNVTAESPKVQGFSYSTPNSTLQALSCTESFWDIVMEIASSGVTDGDMVTLNLLDSNKSVAQQVAMFTIQNGSAEVTKLHPDVKLLVNGMNSKGVGQAAQFLIPAGASGTRTFPLTLVFSTSSPAFMGCYQLSVEVKRGNNIGTTTVVIENIVVKRMERPNDRQTNIGLGLQTGTIGWYPSGKVCDFICWPCQQKQGSWLSGFVYCDSDNDGVKDSGEAGIANVEIRLLNSGGQVVDTTQTDSSGLYKFNIAQPGTYSVMEVQPTGSTVTGDGKDAAGNCGGIAGNDLISNITVTTGVECANYNFGEACGTTTKCDTICWRSTQFFITNSRYLPGGTVLISGVNANNPVGIQQSTNAIRIALQGGSGQMQKLNKEFVTAQLSLAYSGGGGSPVVFNTFWSPLSCSGIAFAPVTLSNGVTLAPNSLLDTLVMQTTLAIKENRLNDMGTLADIWKLLNGRCG
ncbi:MAG TPA: SdrD B-like domain-containing protein [Blastocatellia bacterium]